MKGPMGSNGGGPKMTIEIIVFPGLAFLAVALAAKLIERRNDVLYGPYIHGRKRPFDDFIDQLAEAVALTGLRQRYGRFAFRFAAVSYFASAIIG
jgi:hypothetical protein